MSTKTRRRPKPDRPVQHSIPRSQTHKRGLWILAALGILGLTALVVAVAATQIGGGGSSGGSEAPAGAALPDTSDYHSLLVSQNNPDELVLGTHQGLYRSLDGGRSWSPSALAGQDAMNLVRLSRATAWAAGHNVLAKSIDGGETWTDVRPRGLPGLDVHGFASDPRNRNLYAAIAGQGLYRSTDGGASFQPVSTEVGPAVMALAVLPDGQILAGDMQRGLLSSRDGGRTWKQVLGATVLGLAVNPKRPGEVLAAGQSIFHSLDGGRSWKQVQETPEGSGPVAWAPGDPKIAYAVSFDRQLYRTRDAGQTWSVVE